VLSGVGPAMDVPRQYVVLDTETTGMPPGARLVEIGALLVRGRSILDRFHSLVHPEMPIPAQVTEVHGIDDRMVADAPAAEEVLPAFLEWTRGLPLVAHNAGFDAAILAAECVRLGFPVPHNPVLCTLQASRKVLRRRSHTLESLVRDLDLPAGLHHRAVEDAEHALRLLWHLLDRVPEAMRRSTLGSGRPLSSFAPEPPELPPGRQVLLDAAAAGDALDIHYRLRDRRLVPLRITPRFLYRRREGVMLEALCHQAGHYKHYRVERIVAARPCPDAPPPRLRRPGGRA